MTEQIDMSQFIAARSDQLNADDLLDAPRTITITKVTASPDAAEQPVSIHYEGDGGKPFKPCKTVRRIMVGVWGKHASEYVGRSMTLYRDSAVSFGGMQVGGIRVSHMSHINEKKTVALQVTRGRKAPYTVHPLAATPPSANGNRAKAEAWLADFSASLAGDYADTDAIVKRAERPLAKLKTEHPDLYARAIALTQPSPAAGDFTPAEAQPTAEPAAGSADGGQILTLEQAKAAIEACEIVPDVNARLSELVGNFYEKTADELRAYALDKKARLTGGK